MSIGRALLGLVVGAAAGATLLRAWKLRHLPAEPALPLGSDHREDELRRKLVESRVLVGERDEFESGEVTVDEARPAAESVEERRRAVHEAGRAAAERMRGSVDSG